MTPVMEELPKEHLNGLKNFCKGCSRLLWFFYSKNWAQKWKAMVLLVHMSNGVNIKIVPKPDTDS